MQDSIACEIYDLHRPIPCPRQLQQKKIHILQAATECVISKAHLQTIIFLKHVRSHVFSRSCRDAGKPVGNRLGGISRRLAVLLRNAANSIATRKCLIGVLKFSLNLIILSRKPAAGQAAVTDPREFSQLFEAAPATRAVEGQSFSPNRYSADASQWIGLGKRFAR